MIPAAAERAGQGRERGAGRGCTASLGAVLGERAVLELCGVGGSWERGWETSAKIRKGREPASELLGEVSCSVRTWLCNYRS